MYSQKDALDAIAKEREYQDQKYGPKNSLDNSIGDFLTYMRCYLNQASHDLTAGDRKAALCGLRKIAALGVAAMEVHGVVTRAHEDAPEMTMATDCGPEPAPGPGPDVDLPPEVRDLLARIVGDLPPGVHVRHVVLGPPPNFGGSIFGNMFRR